jgi:2-keto-4-pentenoate hydratase/2-oxohepta-3-ene-1,7-dioic acid hydratase in catechol pathway
MATRSRKKTIPGTSLEIGNLFCIGRNYAEHARELNNPIPTEPVVFLKPTSAVCYSGEQLLLPKQSTRVDHEVEIVIALGPFPEGGGKDLSEAEAFAAIHGIGVGIDFTARDLQEKAKQKGLPWSVAKGFDTFAALSAFVPRPRSPEALENLRFTLEVNGELRQEGHSASMLNSIVKLISYLSGIFTLQAGDLIFTGTPQGVAPVKAGDHIRARLEDWTELQLRVVSAESE